MARSLGGAGRLADGAHQCASRDKWLGWHRSVQFRRLHWIANNTHFLVLPAGAGRPNLASRVLALNLRRLSEDWVRSHGRWERRQSRSKRNGPVTTTDRYGITTLGPERASAQELLQLVRGHWQVENANHSRRDKTFGEDASRIRTGHGPSTNAALNNLALALLILAGRRQFDTVPQAQTPYGMRPREAIELLLATG